MISEKEKIVITWIKLWLDNRFPKKPKPMVGLFSQLTEEQKQRALRQSE